MTTVTQITGNIITLSMPTTASLSATPCSFNFLFDNGDNYLWVTYDVPSGATSGDYVDAEFVSIKIGSTTFLPTVFTLVGSRLIVPQAYCAGITPPYITGTSWQSESSAVLIMSSSACSGRGHAGGTPARGRAG